MKFFFDLDNLCTPTFLMLLLFSLQFLCPNVYGGSMVPRGLLGDRHLATIPQGAGGGERAAFPGEEEGREGGWGTHTMNQTWFSKRCFTLIAPRRHPPPPLYKLRLCPSDSRRRDHNNCVRNLITYEM